MKKNEFKKLTLDKAKKDNTKTIKLIVIILNLEKYNITLNVTFWYQP